MASHEDIPAEPSHFSGDAQPVSWEIRVSNATGTVIPADDVLVGASPTLKYLRSRNGHFEPYRSVHVVLEGQKYEITTDILPTNYLPSEE